MSVQIRGRQILDSTITAAKLVLSDDFSFSGTVSVGSPTQSQHAANKGYVDAQLQGLSPKQAVLVLSTPPAARPCLVQLMPIHSQSCKAHISL